MSYTYKVFVEDSCGGSDKFEVIGVESARYDYDAGTISFFGQQKETETILPLLVVQTRKVVAAIGTEEKE